MNSNNPFNDLPENKIFKNRKILDPERTPTIEEFKERDRQIENIKSLLKHAKDGSCENFLLTGPAGVGKTACITMMLNFLDDAFPDQDIEWIKTEDVENERRALKAISRKLELGKDRGTTNNPYQGNDLGKYYELLNEQICEEETSVIIVFDELEKIFQNNGSKDHGNSLLKKLWDTRAKIANSPGEGSLSIIGITNSARIEESFSSRVASRFEDETIEFPEYNSMELRSILRERAKRAFYAEEIEEGELKIDSVAKGVVSKCAALATQKGGDARYSLRLFRKAGDIGVKEEASQVQIRHVDEANRRIEKNEIINAVKKSNKNIKITLYTILKNSDKCPMTTSELYEEFENIRKEFEVDEIKQRSLRNYIAELDDRALINTSFKNKGLEGGRVRQIKINDLSQTVQKDIMDEIEILQVVE